MSNFDVLMRNYIQISEAVLAELPKQQIAARMSACAVEFTGMVMKSAKLAPVFMSNLEETNEHDKV